MGYQDHIKAAGDQVPAINCAIISISDTRTFETDTSGARIRDLLAAAGHQVISHEIVPDDPDDLAEAVHTLIIRPECQVILTSGGTGIARRDATIEAVVPLLDKELPGFGELFRMLSYEEIGAGAMLSRAVAGISGRTLIFCMPGSPKAVELALSKLILPELAHLVWEIGRQ